MKKRPSWLEEIDQIAKGIKIFFVIWATATIGMAILGVILARG